MQKQIAQNGGGSKNENLGPCTKLNQKFMVNSSGGPHQNVSVYFFLASELPSAEKKNIPTYVENLQSLLVIFYFYLFIYLLLLFIAILKFRNRSRKSFFTTCVTGH